MTPRERRKMLVRAGLADPIPTIAQRRAWEMVDDRTPPAGPADGEFATHQTWVNKASSWIGYTGAKCFDALDRPCRNGGDMKRADEEGAFPVRWYWPHRFPTPEAPSAQVMRIRQAVANAGADGIDIEALRMTEGLTKITASRVDAALNGRAVREGDRWTMTEYGVAETRAEIERLRRASWIRR